MATARRTRSIIRYKHTIVNARMAKRKEYSNKSIYDETGRERERKRARERERALSTLLSVCHHRDGANICGCTFYIIYRMVSVVTYTAAVVVHSFLF